MLKKFMDAVSTQKTARQEENIYRNLIRSEAVIGGDIFGTVADGRRREFFCLDKHTWIWHEEWTDAHGARQVLTTRYDVRPDKILKSQSGSSYKAVGPEEARHLIAAAREYRNRTFRKMYHTSAQA